MALSDSNTKSSARRWCFTSFNIESPPSLESVKDLRYSIYQLEKCPETGNHHYQGYLAFNKTQRLSALKKLAGLETAHFEVARGTDKDNETYCSKAECQLAGPWTTGTPGGGQGERSDLTGFVATIKRGATMAELCDEHPTAFVKYHKSITAVRTAYQGQRTWQTELTVVIGATNLGKTHYVMDLVGPEGYWKNGNPTFWDHYTGQENVVFDEFYGGKFLYSEMLRLVNPSPHYVDTKGSTGTFLGKTVYIISNSPPRSWYPRLDSVDALLRRITTIVVFTGKLECTILRSKEEVTAHQQFEERSDLTSLFSFYSNHSSSNNNYDNLMFDRYGQY